MIEESVFPELLELVFSKLLSFFHLLWSKLDLSWIYLGDLRLLLLIHVLGRRLYTTFLNRRFLLSLLIVKLGVLILDDIDRCSLKLLLHFIILLIPLHCIKLCSLSIYLYLECEHAVLHFLKEQSLSFIGRLFCLSNSWWQLSNTTFLLFLYQNCKIFNFALFFDELFNGLTKTNLVI